MREIKSFRDLDVWQRSVNLTLDIYAIVNSFPNVERFALSLQLTRSACSVPTNIAEGYGRGSPADYAKFVRTARGSVNEVETQVEIAYRVGYLNQDVYEKLIGTCTDLRRMLSALNKALLLKIPPK